MKKHALPFLLVMAFAPLAEAQSSVTLYGLVDDGITYVNSHAGHPNLYLDAGIMQSSRWGLIGSEDLGAGNSIVFDLENRFNENTGASSGSLMFGGWSYAGVQSNQWGTLTFGRQYDFMAYLSVYSNSGYQTIYTAHPYDVDRIAGEFVNNTVKYVSPVIGGVGVGALYGFSNAAGEFGGASGAPRTVSFTVHYEQQSPLSMNFSYTKVDGYGGSAASVLLDATTVRTAGFGVRYAFSGSSLYGLVTNSRVSNLIKGGDDVSSTNIDVGVKYAATPAFCVTPGYSLERIGSWKANQVNLMLDYALSKQTDVYALAAYQKSATAGFPAGMFYIVNPSTNVGYSATDKQVALRIGIRAKF